MSMESGTKQGDEEGIGGVVTPSHLTGGVVAPSAAVGRVQVSVLVSSKGGPLSRMLTLGVELMEEIRGEEGPARRCELRAITRRS